MEFSYCFDFIKKWEGVQSDDPDDPGGLTKYGISQRAFPDLNVKMLTEFQAKQIYKEKYWDRLNCSQLPHYLRLCIFDCGVNQGATFAAINLQKCVGVKQDGVVGPMTTKYCYRKNPAMLLQHYQAYRLERYSLHPRVDKFINGWSRRVLDCYYQSFSSIEHLILPF